MSNQVPGGWSAFSFTLTPQAKEVFASALSDWTGAAYTPFAFASQVVAGANYCFLCEAQFTTYPTTENAVLLYVFAPLSGKPIVHKIVPISP
ncbi:hypothetical protein C7S18_06365 [Ahniella affigens]|uniref:Uncharacterized protein n=1 Tax=Ahniella affigens TaxID=2021234 RepID=A0A2P1PPS0_9GAMM|nr:hypothetical protein [Ahniella affigens]AVP96847.1 hypothetical protein C7S18_06365 [Ahniella affigens]